MNSLFNVYTLYRALVGDSDSDNSYKDSRLTFKWIKLLLIIL